MIFMSLILVWHWKFQKLLSEQHCFWRFCPWQKKNTETSKSYPLFSISCNFLLLHQKQSNGKTLHIKVLLHLHVTSWHVLLWEPRFSSLVALVLWKILRQTLLSQIKHSLGGLMISSVLTQVHTHQHLRWFAGKRTCHRFPMKLGMVSLQYKEMLKT